MSFFVSVLQLFVLYIKNIQTENTSAVYRKINSCGFLVFFCSLCLFQDISNSVMCFYLWQICNLLASSLQGELWDRLAGTTSLFYTYTSAWPLKGLAVEISHNAFSHRETSSQHEQRRNVARVWERPSGWREGVMAQRAWSSRQEGRVSTEGSKVSLKRLEFLFCFSFQLQIRETYCRERRSLHNALCVYICTWSELLYTCNVTVATVDFSRHKSFRTLLLQ